MKNNIFVKIRESFNWYNLSAYGLHLIVVFITVFQLAKIDRGIQSDSLNYIAILASLSSIFLILLKKVKILFRFSISLILGVITSFTIFGNLGSFILTFLQAFFSYINVYIRSLKPESLLSPNPTEWQEAWRIFGDSVQVLINRLTMWFQGLPNPIYDPISINLIIGIGVWLLSIWIFYFLIIKKRALLGIFPAIFISAYISQTKNEGIVVVAWLVFIGLLMEVLSNHSLNEDYWQKQKMVFSKAIRNKSIQLALYISIIAIVIAGFITSPELERFIKDLRERNDDTGSTVYVPGDDGENMPLNPSIVEGPAKTMSDISFGRFPNDHLINSAPELSEEIIMYVRIEDTNPTNDIYYLRSANYDTYTNHGWLTVDRGFIFNPPKWGVPINIELTQNEKFIYQEISLLEESNESNLMFFVGDLLSANVIHFTSYHTKFINETFSDLFASITKEIQYSAYSKVPIYSEEELRNTTLEYPSWISNKYLQIPDSVPDRVYDLALQLTATLPTIYDRALAIEQYLRQFEYTLELKSPPQSQDLVDYFLFDLQKGYCDYYASSMVILARAAGIPARLATGYVASTFDASLGQYIISGDQAHAWTEIYFPDFGWVNFEPTSGRTSLERSAEREIIIEEEIIAQEPSAAIQLLDKILPYMTFGNIFGFLSITITAVVVISFSILWIDKQILKAQSPFKVMKKLYLRLQNQAKQLGLEVKDIDTPNEFLELLSEYLINVQKTNPFTEKILESTPQHSSFIINFCNQIAYTKSIPDFMDVHQAINSWGKLRWQFRFLRSLLKIDSFTNKIQNIWRRDKQAF